MRRAWLLPIALGALIAGAFVWFRATNVTVVGWPSALSVADVYQRAEQELRQHDGIYVAELEAAYDSAFFGPSSGTITRWVDVHRDAAREESDMKPLGAYAMVTTREGRYARDASGGITATSPRYSMCNGVGIAAGAVLGCPGPTERSTTEVRDGIHEGRPAIVLVTSGTMSGEDETYTFTRRLYLDARSYLPLALEEEGLIDAGQVMPAHVRVRVQHRFVSADAVASDLFDPTSIGYSGEAPAQALDRLSTDMQVYWLGNEFGGAAGLPTLVLSRTETPERGPGYRVILSYTARDDRYGPPLVTFQLWPRAAWDVILRQARFNYRDDPCWSREELTLAGGSAFIFSGFEATAALGAPAVSGSACPSRPRDNFLSEVYFADAVLLLNMPSVISVGGVTTSPYNSHEGIRALVRGLRQR